MQMGQPLNAPGPLPCPVSPAIQKYLCCLYRCTKFGQISHGALKCKGQTGLAMLITARPNFNISRCRVPI